MQAAEPTAETLRNPLAHHAGAGLIAIGLPGLLIGWACSAPPLAFNSHGLGEPSVAAGFTLIVIGTDFVLRHAFSAEPLVAATSYTLLVTNILYINQFPDCAADAQAGRRHWVVRLGAQRAACGYHLIALVAYAWSMLAALSALASLPLSFAASRRLARDAGRSSQLAAAIKLTIGAAVVHGVLLALAIYFRGHP
jgi:1,4-dihydroxy-2-naphthoate octaprenyltransferase